MWAPFEDIPRASPGRGLQLQPPTPCPLTHTSPPELLIFSSPTPLPCPGFHLCPTGCYSFLPPFCSSVPTQVFLGLFLVFYGSLSKKEPRLEAVDPGHLQRPRPHPHSCTVPQGQHGTGSEQPTLKPREALGNPWSRQPTLRELSGPGGCEARPRQEAGVWPRSPLFTFLRGSEASPPPSAQRGGED